jgi:hypothetical protein
MNLNSPLQSATACIRSNLLSPEYCLEVLGFIGGLDIVHPALQGGQPFSMAATNLSVSS